MRLSWIVPLRLCGTAYPNDLRQVKIHLFLSTSTAPDHRPCANANMLKQELACTKGVLVGQVEAYLVGGSDWKDCSLRLFTATFGRSCSGGYLNLKKGVVCGDDLFTPEASAMGFFSFIGHSSPAPLRRPSPPEPARLPDVECVIRGRMPQPQVRIQGVLCIVHRVEYRDG